MLHAGQTYWTDMQKRCEVRWRHEQLIESLLLSFKIHPSFAHMGMDKCFGYWLAKLSRVSMSRRQLSHIIYRTELASRA